MKTDLSFWSKIKDRCIENLFLLLLLAVHNEKDLHGVSA